VARVLSDVKSFPVDSLPVCVVVSMYCVNM